MNSIFYIFNPCGQCFLNRKTEKLAVLMRENLVL